MFKLLLALSFLILAIGVDSFNWFNKQQQVQQTVNQPNCTARPNNLVSYDYSKLSKKWFEYSRINNELQTNKYCWTLQFSGTAPNGNLAMSYTTNPSTNSRTVINVPLTLTSSGSNQFKGTFSFGTMDMTVTGFNEADGAAIIFGCSNGKQYGWVLGANKPSLFSILTSSIPLFQTFNGTTMGLNTQSVVVTGRECDNSYN